MVDADEENITTPNHESGVGGRNSDKKYYYYYYYYFHLLLCLLFRSLFLRFVISIYLLISAVLAGAESRMFDVNMNAMSPPIRAALIDLSGTIHVADQPIAGAIEAMRKLHSLKIPTKFLTNTSKTSSADLTAQLRRMGFDTTAVPEGSVMTSATAAKDLLVKHNLRPLCLVEEILKDDLKGVDVSESKPNCVLVGLAPSAFCYNRLNEAFRLLVQLKDEKEKSDVVDDTSPLLFAIHRGKYLRDGDGELSLGPGGFVSCLEEASGVKAITVGKPSPSFFQSAISDWTSQGIKPEEIVMVGDDAQQDVLGAIEAGLGFGVLVKTGKYRDGDEAKLLRSGKENAFAVTDVAEAVDFIVSKMSS